MTRRGRRKPKCCDGTVSPTPPGKEPPHRCVPSAAARVRRGTMPRTKRISLCLRVLRPPRIVNGMMSKWRPRKTGSLYHRHRHDRRRMAMTRLLLLQRVAVSVAHDRNQPKKVAGSFQHESRGTEEARRHFQRHGGVLSFGPTTACVRFQHGGCARKDRHQSGGEGKLV